MFDPRLETLKPQSGQYWADRALYQLEYAHEVSSVNGRRFDTLLEQGLNDLLAANAQDGAITRAAVEALEARLAPIAADAKRINLICAAHAHIDMNWMWRWDETVAVTLDTFRTMLDLMREYPDFTFSQSQASVYQVVEQYDPDMLDEIRRRVKEGRWEVTASTWVEADKNMPNGESHARHLLYTRRYLSKLLGLMTDNFRLDYEPDTFGHHANVPEILADGGVKYYYHCRGDQDNLLYRWVAPSGRSILVYREADWYGGYIDPAFALTAPAFCQQYGLDSMLRVYGVGDHGGGPTRRDIERLLDMDAWPIFPTIRFGTYAEFFDRAAQAGDQIPEVSGERNYIFTGCYSSQSRIKRGNRQTEAALYTAEAFSALASLQGAAYPGEKYAAAWKNTLFNQFHDIIPGSGVIDTREYALGLYQQTLATAASQKRRAFRFLAEGDAIPEGQRRDGADPQDISEGAGVGFGVEEFRLSQVARGSGLRRLFHIFNPLPWERRQVVELVVWDWNGDLARLALTDEQGNSLAFQVLDKGWNNYWGHRYLRVLVDVTTPPCGYDSVLLEQTVDILDAPGRGHSMRTETPVSLQLENEYLRATFDPHSCALVSLVDKASGQELVRPGQAALFRRIQEDVKGMSAWFLGRYMTVEPLSEGARLLSQESGDLRQGFSYEVATGPSKLTVQVWLDANSRRLEYDVLCDWHEIGRKEEGVPQLNFHLPLAYPVRAYRYDIPFGTVERPGMAQDVPGNSWGAAVWEDAPAPVVQLVTEGNYSFRGDEQSLSLTLIRSSYDPDPYPELGRHKIRFAVQVVDEPANTVLVNAAADYTRPLEVTTSAGNQALRWSFLDFESRSVILAALKAPEDGEKDALIVRLYETEGLSAPAELRFARKVQSAAWVNVHEQAADTPADLQIDAKQVVFTLPPYRLATLRVKFAKV